MSKLEFDPTDTALTLALAISGFIMTGIATFTLFDVSFTDTIFSVGGYNITIAYAMSVVALAGTIYTNENTGIDTLSDDIKDLDDYYKYATIATGGLIAAWLFIPAVGDFFTSSDAMALVYVGVTTTGQFVLGWML